MLKYGCRCGSHIILLLACLLVIHVINSGTKLFYSPSTHSWAYFVSSTTAILKAFTFTLSAHSSSQAFACFHPASRTILIQVFTYRFLLHKLGECLTFLGYPPSEYAGYSLCATHAFQSGVSIEFIKMLGD